MSRPARIQRKREKGWRTPENTVYVGRPTKWGNPFRAGEHGYDHDWCESSAQAVEMFRYWMDDIEEAEFVTKRTMLVTEARKELRGKNLACWCSLDQPCHADVLLELANVAEKE